MRVSYLILNRPEVTGIRCHPYSCFPNWLGANQYEWTNVLVASRRTARHGVGPLSRRVVRLAGHSVQNGNATELHPPGNNMSYDLDLLFQCITRVMLVRPSVSLREIAQELNVGLRTIETVVKAKSGQGFREFQKQQLLCRAIEILDRQAALSIKELSFAMGYKSPRSFSRAIKRTCGLCPGELRSLISGLLLNGASMRPGSGRVRRQDPQTSVNQSS